MENKQPKSYAIGIKNGNGWSEHVFYSREEAENYCKEWNAKYNIPAEILSVEDCVKCPTCNQWCGESTINTIGECLRCDHVRGDVDMEEQYFDEDEREYL